MFNLRNTKRKVLVCTILFAFVLVNTATAKAEEMFVQINISWHSQYDKIISRLGEIWLGYIPVSGKTIITSGGNERFIIKRINYYYKKDGDLIFMGHVDVTGVHDRNGNILRAIPDTRHGDARILGISSIEVEKRSLSISFIFFPATSNSYWESDIWVDLDIDIESASIRLFDRSGFVP
ncbi:MAG: hypothetical protein FWC64_09355 [Treponema sp.]|nr:hypothetical protein [Treponema sp.]